MLGKKAPKSHGGDHEGQTHVGKPATAKGRTLLLLSLLLAALSIACLAVGVALLQWRVHHRRSTSGDMSSIMNSYKDVLQSAHYTPYSDAHSRQWMFLWWIVACATSVWLLTAFLTLSAVRIVQWHPTLIGLHIYVLVLCTFAIDSFLWINHYDQSRAIFGKKRVAVTLAGLLGLAVASGLGVLALGFIPSKRHIDSRYVQGSGIAERIIEKEVRLPAPVSAPRVSTHESYLPNRHDTPTFTNNPAQPVRVHMGDTSNVVGATELGARRY